MRTTATDPAVRVSLTRTVQFFALHRFARAEWTDAENLAAYGALAEEPGHGHDYTCAVTVTGPVAPDGTIVDLAALDRLLAVEVIGPLDGAHLNRVIPAFLAGRSLPTCEGLAVHLYRRIAAGLPAGVRLERVRIAEDHSLYADCTGAV